MRALSSRPFCPYKGRPGKLVVISRRVQGHDPLRELGRNHGYGAGRLSVRSVAIVSGTCLLLPGDNIIPNNLTMPLYVRFCGVARNAMRPIGSDKPLSVTQARHDRAG